MRQIQKKSGSLSLEFALLLPLLFTFFMTMFSLVYSVNIKAEIDRGVGKALEDLSSEIYLSSKLLKDSSLLKEINEIIEPLNEYLGLKINLSKILTEELIKTRIRQKTYAYLGGKSKLFWMKGQMNFDLAYSSNTLIVKSKSNIKLPVLNAIMGEIRFERTHIQAARGIDRLLEDGDGKNNGTMSITICEYSHSGKSASPVFHTKKCMGRKKEKSEKSISFQIPKEDISKDGKILYRGKSYRYCKFCKKMEAIEK